MAAADILLFAYGTLQFADVQLATIGRLLEGRPDRLDGYCLEPLTITSPEAVAISGAEIHNIACRTGDPGHSIPGMVYQVTADEIARADAYETDAYARIEIVLASGKRAFAYVGPDA